MATPDTTWCLVDRNGTHYKLPYSSIYLGREDCDITLKSRSVDPRHAVITHDRYDKQFKVKDLNSLNGTFVNETRIAENEFLSLDHMDTVRFGYDPMVYRLERIEEISPTDTQPDIRNSTDHRNHREHSISTGCPGCLAEQGFKHTCDTSVRSETNPAHRPCSPSGSPGPAPGSSYSSWPRNRHIKDLTMQPMPDQRYRYPDEFVQKHYPPDYHPDVPSYPPPMAYYPPVYQPMPHDIRRENFQSDYYRLVHRANDWDHSSGAPVHYRDLDTPPQYRDRDPALAPPPGGLGGALPPPAYGQQTPDVYARYTGSEERNGRYSPQRRNSRGEGVDPPPDIVPQRLTRRRSETEKMDNIKKGTPLYGQPSWWGEDDHPDMDLNETETKTHVNRIKKGEDKGSVGSSPEQSMSTNSVRKLSLQESDSVQNKSSEPSKPVEPSMAFTVDFTDERPKKKLSGNLGKFLPNKLRKGKPEKGRKENDRPADQVDNDISVDNVFNEEIIDSVSTSGLNSEPAPAEPALAPSEPALAPSEPDLSPSKPALSPSEPALAPSEPALAPSDSPSAAPPGGEGVTGGRKRGGDDNQSDDEISTKSDKVSKDKRKRIIPQTNKTTPRSSSSSRMPRPKLPPSAQSRDKDSARSRDKECALVDSLFTAKSTSRRNSAKNDQPPLKSGETPSNSHNGLNGHSKVRNGSKSSQNEQSKTKVKVKDGDIREGEEERSEAGTYTIDSPSEEVEMARQNISAVFGVNDSGAEDGLDNVPDVRDADDGDDADDDGDEGDADADDTDASDQLEVDDIPVIDAVDGDVTNNAREDIELCGEPPNWVKRWTSDGAQRPTQVSMPVNTATFTRRKVARTKLPGLSHNSESQSEPNTPVRTEVDWPSDHWKSNHAFVPYREPTNPHSKNHSEADVLLNDTSHVVQALETMVHSRQRSDPVTSSVTSSVPPKRSGGAVIAPRPIKPKGRSKKEEMSVKEKVLFHLSSSGQGEGRYTDSSRSLSGIQPGHVTSRDHREPDDVSESGSMVSARSELSETNNSQSQSYSRKSKITTRTNRTFALRRARADESSAAATKSSARTQSPSARSDISQGSQSSRTGAKASSQRQNSNSNSTIRKGYQSEAVGVKGGKNPELGRSDGGRYSMRARDTRSSSVEAQYKTNNKNSSLNASRSVTSLTGTNQRRTSFESQKQAEKTAWRRRKEYDPRASVAKAKVKVKVKKDEDPRSSCSTPDRPRRLRRDTYTSSAEDISLLSIESGACDSDAESVSFRSDTIASASRELAKDLSSMTGESGHHRPDDFHTAELIDSMFRDHQSFSSKPVLNHSKRSLPSNSNYSNAQPSNLHNNNNNSNNNSSSAPLAARSAFTTPNSTASSTSSTPRTNLTNHRAASSQSTNQRAASSQSLTNDQNCNGLEQSYDTLMVSSISQLSTKIKDSTDKFMQKLREVDRLSRSPSPVQYSGDKCEIPAWRDANQHLANILSNLRAVEHHVKVIDGALFPDGTERNSTIDITSKSDSDQYRQRVEKAGFKPIEQPSDWTPAQQSTSFDDDDEYF